MKVSINERSLDREEKTSAVRRFLLILTALLCTGYWGSCFAEEAVYNFNIPKSSASTALNKVAEQSGSFVLFPFDHVSTIETNEVKGELTLSDALKNLLAGTNLKAEVIENGVITVSFVSDQKDNKGNTEMSNVSKNAFIVGIAGIASAFSAANAQDAGVEEILVSGIRQSLESANLRKREANSFMDSIVAEDLGKFPDQNVAESLQRITGVTIDRVSGEGAQITVRGFGPEFNIVRINDRTLATVTEERNFDFQVLPSELISGADIVKSPTADMWGGSIGASVNLRTARPLDNPGLQLSGGVQGRYQDLSDDLGPSISGVFSNTFADNTMGILIGAAFEDRVIRTDESRNGEGERNGWLLFDGPVDGPGSEERQFRVPARMGQSFTLDDRQRFGAQGTFQWQPSDRAEVTLDALYVDFERKSNLRGIVAPLQFATFDPENLVINENGTAVSFTKNFAPLDIRFETDDQDSETLALGLNGIFDINEAWSASGDISWSRAEAYNEDRLIAPGIRDNNPLNDPLPGGTDDPDFAQNMITWENGDVPSWTNTFDVSDPANARAHVTRSLANDLKDEVFEARFDASFESEGPFFRGGETGIFYSDREKTNVPFNNGVSPTGEDSLLGGNLPGPIVPGAPLDGFGRPNTAGRFFRPPAEFFTPITMSDLLAESNSTFPKSFLDIDVDGYCGWLRENTGNDKICSLNQRLEFRTGVEETVAGAYVRLDFGGELGSMLWTGNFGLRYEDTETTSKGPFQELISITPQDPDGSTSQLIVETSPSEVVEADNSYSNLLPSLNFALEATDEVLLRFAAAKSITRPTLNQIVPGETFPNRNFENFRTVATNPGLEPFETAQLDGSIEYFARNGNAFSITLFYKDISTFISERTELVDTGFDHPAFGDIITREQAPRNRSGGTIQGYELAALVHFDFLEGFLSNLGVQANYTFISSEDEQANVELGSLPLAKLPTTGLEGFTPNAYNLIGFYEDDRFRARLAFTWRDEFLDVRSGPESIPAHFAEYGQLDAGFGYKLTDSIELTFEASNLTNENTIRFADIRERVILNEYTGRRFFAGVRASF